MIAKNIAPTTTPMKKNCRTAITFSAVLAVSATLIPEQQHRVDHRVDAKSDEPTG